MILNNRNELRRWLHDWRKFGPPGSPRRVILTNGCFDIIHAAHCQFFLELARRAWCPSISFAILVAVNSDESVRRFKPGRPINELRDRMTVLNSLKLVDAVCSFEETTPLSIVKFVKPDVLAKGGDWQEDTIIGAKSVKSRGGQVWVIPYKKGYSTTGIIERIQNRKDEGA